MLAALFLMNPLLWSILAAIPAVGLEYCYRALRGSWLTFLWLYAPASILISFCIYRLVNQPGVPLVGALIFWSVSVIGLRILVTVVLLKDHVPPGTWAALVLLVLARIVQAMWR